MEDPKKRNEKREKTRTCERAANRESDRPSPLMKDVEAEQHPAFQWNAKTLDLTVTVALVICRLDAITMRGL